MPSSLQNQQPYKFVARTCSDALETTEQEPGLMTQLSNLISDPSTKNLWVARPALVLLGSVTSVAGTFTNITSLIVVGNYAYGTVTCTAGAFAGSDIAFCFDL